MAFGLYNNSYPFGNYYQQPPIPDNLANLRAIQQQPNNFSPQQQNAFNQPNSAQNSSGMIWVQGEEGAKAYLVAPNSSVCLWDSENQTIYLKSADSSGVPSLRILDWTERNGTQNSINKSVQQPFDINLFLTKDEFYQFKENIEKKLNEEKTRKETNKKSKGDTNE